MAEPAEARRRRQAPEAVARVKASHTGKLLAKTLKNGRPRA